jgi:putative ABC transport system ATP-binding protein
MLIAGIIAPKSGKILIDNQKMNDTTFSELRKKMCWLPQSPDIIGKGNVKELIISRLGFSDIDVKDDIIIKNMEQLNLSKDLLEKNFESLSGGEKQRLGILICKMLQKQIILLDEPTSALDSDSKKLASDYLLYSKATVISVSHDKDWIDLNNRKFEL